MTTLPHMEQLGDIIAQLREHCPWTAQLDHRALTPYLLEEAQEVAEEIEAGIVGEPLRKELGDILLQVVLHSAPAISTPTATVSTMWQRRSAPSSSGAIPMSSNRTGG